MNNRRNKALYNLIELIQYFDEKNTKDAGDEKTKEWIMQILKYYDGQVPIKIGHYSKGITLYRVRQMDVSDVNSEDDFWNPPAEYIKEKGRLNKESESLLYLGVTFPTLAISECRLKKNDKFFLMRYKIVEDIKIGMIGGEVSEPVVGLDGFSSELFKLKNDFLNKWFYSPGNSDVYRITNLIKACYLELVPQYSDIDAWVYGSAFDSKYFNIACIPEQIKGKIELETATYCINFLENNDMHCFVFKIMDVFIDSKGKLFSKLPETPTELVVSPSLTKDINDITAELSKLNIFKLDDLIDKERSIVEKYVEIKNKIT